MQETTPCEYKRANGGEGGEEEEEEEEDPSSSCVYLCFYAVLAPVIRLDKR